MVKPLLRLLLLGLLVLHAPGLAEARLTLGWVKGAAILGSEEQARRLAAHLEKRLAEPVVLRACASEAQLHEWLHRYRMVDLAPVSAGYFRQVPAGELLPVATVRTAAAEAQIVTRQGLRSDQQLQLRTLLANLPEEPAGRDLLVDLGGLRLSPPQGAPRPTLATSSPLPAAPARQTPPAVSWPDERPVAVAVSPAPVVLPAPPEVELPVVAGPAPVPVPATVEPVKETAPAPVVLPEPPKVELPVVAAPAPVPVPAVVEPVKEPAPAPVVLPAPPKPAAKVTPPPAAEPGKPQPKPEVKEPPKVAALPAKPPVAPPVEVRPALSQETVSRSLSSGRQTPLDGGTLQTIYLVPFATVMVPQPVAEAVFDRFVDTLNLEGPQRGYEFVILKEDFTQVDPIWLRKATYVTGEIFGYVEESGCCSTDIRSKSRLALYRPGSTEPKLRHEFPAKAFFDHDYSTLEAERRKLAERISNDLSGQLLKALGGG